MPARKRTPAKAQAPRRAAKPAAAKPAAAGGSAKAALLERGSPKPAPQEARRATRSKRQVAGHLGESITITRETRPIRSPKLELGVDEKGAKPIRRGVAHESTAEIGRAGDQFIPAGEGDDDPDNPDETIIEPGKLDGEGVATILRAVFRGIALITRDDYYAIEDMEIDEICDPIARQINRIPVVAQYLDQNTTDLIAIGSGAGALVWDRIQHFQEVRKAKGERTLRPLRTDRPTVVDVDGRPSPAPPAAPAAAAAASSRYEETATARVDLGGDLHQEIRESRGEPNFGHLRPTGS